jgi:hypothetical protein
LPAIVTAAAMPFFRKPYTSEFTQFLQELKQQQPSIEEGQRAGRALLWDRAIDREAQQSVRQAKVPQQPYVYQTKAR